MWEHTQKQRAADLQEAASRREADLQEEAENRLSQSRRNVIAQIALVAFTIENIVILAAILAAVLYKS